MEEVRRSIEALKKTQEDNNLKLQLQMDKLLGLMANFMNGPANRELPDKQSSYQANFGNHSVNVVPAVASWRTISSIVVVDVMNGGSRTSTVSVVTTFGMNSNTCTCLY